jgi:hypothetical protein
MRLKKRYTKKALKAPYTSKVISITYRSFASANSASYIKQATKSIAERFKRALSYYGLSTPYIRAVQEIRLVIIRSSLLEIQNNKAIGF